MRRFGVSFVYGKNDDGYAWWIKEYRAGKSLILQLFRLTLIWTLALMREMG
jgi:hypothetical protein